MQTEDTSVEDVEPLVKAVAERDKQLRHVESERSAVKAATVTFCVELNNLEREVMSRLDNLGAKFDASPDHAREALTASPRASVSASSRTTASIEWSALGSGARPFHAWRRT